MLRGLKSKITDQVQMETSQSDDEFAIRIEHVCKWFGDLLVLRDVSLNIKRNEFVCVVGPSGSGKTTLLRMLNGLTEIDAGRIVVDDVEVHNPRRDMAMVFQQFDLFPWKTIEKNIAFPLELAKMNKSDIKERVAWAVKLVGLEGFEKRYPSQLSGGMRQRVGLARALVVRPKVLLLDEPFGAVDAQTRETLQEELLGIWTELRQTAVFITHSIDEAITLADRIVVMSARPGRIVGILDVEIPRPRTVESVRKSPLYPELREQVRGLIGGREEAHE
ncbi:MAG TPA: ABC transporter ATP-binding protein [Candidatus Nanopelagicaceae bacterium]|nr:ABC transporter ATP-binding protein [Candidatus Nanopelagicaceae bacterium]